VDHTEKKVEFKWQDVNTRGKTARIENKDKGLNSRIRKNQLDVTGIDVYSR